MRRESVGGRDGAMRWPSRNFCHIMAAVGDDESSFTGNVGCKHSDDKARRRQTLDETICDV